MIISDLHVNVDIAPDIIKELRKPDSEAVKVALKDNPGKNIEQIIYYIECVIKASKKSIWSNKWVITLIIAIIIFVIAFIIYKVAGKGGFGFPSRKLNNTIDGNLTESLNETEDIINETIGNITE